jgi:hypothetical protein
VPSALDFVLAPNDLGYQGDRLLLAGGGLSGLLRLPLPAVASRLVGASGDAEAGEYRESSSGFWGSHCCNHSFGRVGISANLDPNPSPLSGTESS